jgi:hypothetical protein
MIKYLIICFVNLVVFTGFSQNTPPSQNVSLKRVTKFTISGVIVEKGSGELLAGVTVYRKGSSEATSSNPYGFYSITLPAVDTLDLVFALVGYEAHTVKLKLDKNINISMELRPLNKLEEVEIIAKKNETLSNDVQMSKIDLPIEKVKEIPSLLGEKDVLKVLQLLPGVQKSREGSSGFYVRGGGPDQNLIILDDATVYNVFHLFGFFSLFNGDALKSVELTKGGFPARYGGRLSSVIDMQMKEGNKEKLEGEAGIGIISSRLTLQGPLLKNKSSFLVSARRTYIDALISPFLPKERKSGYYFYDLNAKVNYILGAKDRLFLSGYFGKDKFYSNIGSSGFRSSTGINWGNATATARWNHIFGSKLFANTSLIFTDYKLNISNESKTDISVFSLFYTSGIRDYSFKMAFDYLPHPKHTMKLGFHGIYHQFRPGAEVVQGTFNQDSLKSPSLMEAFENALYVEDDWKISAKWRANAGARLSHFNIKNQHFFNPEPRLGIRYLITSTFSLKASYSLMNQYMHLLSNTGVGLPTDLWVPATRKAPFMRSNQVALGVVKDLEKKDFDISLEAYYKDMQNVLGYKEGASFLEALGANKGEGNNWEDKVTSGHGWSYGAELFVRKNSGKFTGWIGYTLSWTELQFDNVNFGKKFYAKYDRRHDISLVGVYKINRRMTLSGTWVYGTGNAITLPQNSYQANIYGPSYSSNNPSPLNQASLYNIQDYGQQRNAQRMSPYHRMDIGLQLHKQKKRYTRIIEFSIYNVYNRQNPFYYFIGANDKGDQELMQVSLFPFIPSISGTWKF